MTRGELEAAIWGITRRKLTGTQVDAILDIAEQYAAERCPREPRQALHHTGGTDLYPVIGLLAEVMEAAR